MSYNEVTRKTEYRLKCSGNHQCGRADDCFDEVVFDSFEAWDKARDHVLEMERDRDEYGHKVEIQRVDVVSRN